MNIEGKQGKDCCLRMVFIIGAGDVLKRKLSLNRLSGIVTGIGLG